MIYSVVDPVVSFCDYSPLANTVFATANNRKSLLQGSLPGILKLMNVVVSGLMTSYQKTGNGKVIILLHGWGDSSVTFSGLIDQLQNKYTIYALDLPGFGGTEPPYRAWGISDYTKFIAEWLKKIDVKDVEAFVGHSYGGACAISGVGGGILKPKKLVLLSSSGIRDVYKVRRLALKSAAKLVRVPLGVLPGRLRTRLKRKAYMAIGSDAMLLPHMELTFKRLINEDLQSVAKKISVPTLLIYGTKDQDTPIKYGRLFHEAINNSRLEIIESGHFLHQEQPGQVAKLVKDFLQ